MNKKKYFKSVYVYEFLKHKDNRGFFVELFNQKDLRKKLDINFNCLQTCLAYSKKKYFVDSIFKISNLLSN